MQATELGNVCNQALEEIA